LASNRTLHLHARLGADVLQTGTALADHDRLLAFAFDPDDRADAQQVAVFDEAFDLHRGGIRQFFAELAHELLADQFASEEALAAVGDFIFAEHRRGHRQQLEQVTHQRFQAVALLRGNGVNGGERAAFGDLLQERQQRGLVLHAVHLVHDQHHRHAGVAEHVEGKRVFVVPAAGFDHQHAGVHALERPARGAVHDPVHGALLHAVQPGGVDQYQLPFRVAGNAQQPVTGGLRPVGHDADLAPTRALVRVDLPTLGRPMTATLPQ
jgi:hypothetical protein